MIASRATRRGHGDFGLGGVSLTAPRNSPAAVDGVGHAATQLAVLNRLAGVLPAGALIRRAGGVDGLAR